VVHNGGYESLRGTDVSKINLNICVKRLKHHFKSLINSEKFCQKKAKSIDSKTRKNQKQYQAKAASANFSLHAVPIDGFTGLPDFFHDVLMLIIDFILNFFETIQNELVSLEKRHESA
jgi:hypothetical protein